MRISEFLRRKMAVRLELVEKFLEWKDQPSFDERLALGPSLREVEGRIQDRIDAFIYDYEKSKEDGKESITSDPALVREYLRWSASIYEDVWVFSRLRSVSRSGIRNYEDFYATARGLVPIYSDTEIPLDVIESEDKVGDEESFL